MPLSEQGAREPSGRSMNSIVLYGNPTLSDFDFLMDSELRSFPSSNTSTSSSIQSDASSAPLEFEEILDIISKESLKWIERSGRQVPPEWTTSDLVREVIGTDWISIEGLLRDHFYDIMLHGPNSWLSQDLFAFLDLINYTF